MDEEALRAILEEFFQRLNTLLEGLPQEETLTNTLTKRALLELVSHEAIVPEAYKDSRGIWTFGIGMTNASGHRINRYIDKPQSIPRVIELFKWVVENKYLPAVLKAFDGYPLNEAELAAAVSFHYNTGAIGYASWVKSVLLGRREQAERQIMDWKKPLAIKERREKERDLFFHGKWSNDGEVTVYTHVRKPSYVPDWGSAKRIDIGEEL